MSGLKVLAASSLNGVKVAATKPSTRSGAGVARAHAKRAKQDSKAKDILIVARVFSSFFQAAQCLQSPAVVQFLSATRLRR